MSDDWIIRDLQTAENTIAQLEREVSKLESTTSKLEDKVRTLENVAEFMLTESKAAHVEKTKGGCTPACPKCKFYKELGEILYE